MEHPTADDIDGSGYEADDQQADDQAFGVGVGMQVREGVHASESTRATAQANFLLLVAVVVLVVIVWIGIVIPAYQLARMILQDVYF